ncbi:MAG: BtpA/SgcQ family protein [Rhodospirillaceae bacterium]|nr:MAG: BtpA/SgcQ family protein [Rhodospirillaceae bacterium]
MLKETFGSTKPIISMVHLLPLPGSPLYDAKGGVNAIIDSAARDIEKLQDGGVDCIMFGNEGDRPYLIKSTPESLAAMAAAVSALKPIIKIPFGVDYLWDPVATVALGNATGARFGREVMTGVYDSDMGLWQPDAASAIRLRHNLARDDFKMMYNVNAEFASPIGTRTIAQRAKSAVFSALADVVLVSGIMTGQAVDTSDIKSVKEVLTDTPVFANTGVNIDNVKSILSVGDGCVIGTHFKVDGNTWNAVDGDRVKRFMDVVNKVR